MSNINKLVYEAFYHEFDHFKPGDLNDFKEVLFKYSEKLDFEVNTLYTVNRNEVYILSRDSERDNPPNILIVSGFHGEEVGGPWGIIRFLEMASIDFLDNINLTIIPIVNPTGFKHGKRGNDWGGAPNSGYIKQDKKDYLSVEGKNLKSYSNILVPRSTDGMLTLHEDGFSTRFYLYVNSNDPNEKISHNLLNVADNYFGIVPDNTNINQGFTNEKTIKVFDGRIKNMDDGTFEHYMFDKGSKITICTETPQQKDINMRADCNADLIYTFCRSILKNKIKENKKLI